ncbi:MAG: hypothetical protein ACJ8GW_08940 [Massilia sp.]
MHTTRQQRGATLLLGVVILLIIAGLASFAYFVFGNTKHKLTVDTSMTARFARIDGALAEFVAAHRRLPCPALGTDNSSAVTAGVEQPATPGGACNPSNQSTGVVPWVTLGLTEDEILDAWNARISYRVQPSLASGTLLLMNMSWCDPAGTTNATVGAALACNAPCTGAACRNPLNYLYGKGLAVQDRAGNWLNQPAPAWAGAPTPPPLSTGAAYVLISHGPNGLSSYNSNGTPRSQPAGFELNNANGRPLLGTTIFIDDVRNTGGAVYFDDMLSHPTITTVLERAALASRTPH